MVHHQEQGQRIGWELQPQQGDPEHGDSLYYDVCYQFLICETGLYAYFINLCPFSIASREFNKGNRLKSRFRFCILRLKDFEPKSEQPVNLVEQDGKDTDIGSALRRYVKAASIARSLTPSMQNLNMDDVPRHTFLPESVNTTLSTHLPQVSDATEKVRKADNQRTALHKAAKSGEELYIVKILLENGADVNAKTADGTTALHLAAQYGNENAARVLLEHGANVHARMVPPQGQLDGAEIRRREDTPSLGGS